MTALGADSTKPLASARPRPVSSRTTYLDLRSGVETGEDDVELGLLLGSGSSSAGSGSGHGGGGNAELFLERVDELRELQNGKALDLFDHSSDLFRHCNILLI